MTPGTIRGSIVGERVAWVRQMLDGLRQLPLDSIESFRQDPRNPAAAESYLRRAIEALLDLGRHILAKGFGVAAAEYYYPSISCFFCSIFGGPRCARDSAPPICSSLRFGVFARELFFLQWVAARLRWVLRGDPSFRYRNPRPLQSELQPTRSTDAAGTTMWTPNPYFYRFRVHLSGPVRNGSMIPHGL